MSNISTDISSVVLPVSGSKVQNLATSRERFSGEGDQSIALQKSQLESTQGSQDGDSIRKSERVCQSEQNRGEDFRNVLQKRIEEGEDNEPVQDQQSEQEGLCLSDQNKVGQAEENSEQIVSEDIESQDTSVEVADQLIANNFCLQNCVHQSDTPEQEPPVEKSQVQLQNNLQVVAGESQKHNEQAMLSNEGATEKLNVRIQNSIAQSTDGLPEQANEENAQKESVLQTNPEKKESFQSQFENNQQNRAAETTDSGSIGDIVEGKQFTEAVKQQLENAVPQDQVRTPEAEQVQVQTPESEQVQAQLQAARTAKEGYTIELGKDEADKNGQVKTELQTNYSNYKQNEQSAGETGEIKSTNIDVQNQVVVEETQRQTLQNTVALRASVSVQSNPNADSQVMANTNTQAGQTVDVDAPFKAFIGPAEQVMEQIQVRLNGVEQEINVTLTPPELGMVRITFRRTGDELRGIVEVERRQTRYDIEKSLPEIANTLRQAGVDVKRMEVVMNQQSERNQFSNLNDSGSMARHEFYEGKPDSNNQDNSTARISEQFTGESIGSRRIQHVDQISDEEINVYV